MKSVLANTGNAEIKRIRVGVGDRGYAEAKDYVLGNFTKDDAEAMKESIEHAAKAAMAAMEKPFERVMSDYNRK